MKTRVFISLAARQDVEARNEIVRWSLRNGSSFTVCGWSSSPADLREHWDTETRRQIGEADVVVALFGASPWLASQVRDELRIARALGKEVIGVRVEGREAQDDELGPLVPLSEARKLIERVPS
jgi:hypothetical protein